MRSAMPALIITIIGVGCENFAATKVLRSHFNAIIILKNRSVTDMQIFYTKII